MFEKKMVTQISLKDSQNFEQLWNDAADLGAHDVTEPEAQDNQSEKIVEVSSPPSQLIFLYFCTQVIASREDGGKITKGLQDLEYDIVQSEIVHVPKDMGVDVEEAKDAVKVLIEELEDNPDVSRISTSPKI